MFQKHRFAVARLLAAMSVGGACLNGKILSRCDAAAPVESPTRTEATGVIEGDRSPVDLALTRDGEWIVVANQTSHSVSLVRSSDGTVVDEVRCGVRPTAVVFTPDEQRVLVASSHSGELTVFRRENNRLHLLATVDLKHEPHGIAVSPTGTTAYVALAGANCVAVVDLETYQLRNQIAVGKWPRYVGLSADGTRLAVGCSGDGGISVVDIATEETQFTTKFQGLNIGHLAISADGQYAYFPWMVYTDRPITIRNIQEGWVLGNRFARVRLDQFARREAIALDPRGKAVADPHGVALSPDESWIALTASGTHELVLLKSQGLAFRTDGPGDHIRPDLAADDTRFVRIALGGRPMAVRFSADGQRVFVANYLLNSIQIINVAEQKVEREIAMGNAAEESLARKGEVIFHDAFRSTDGWYSCHSCHYDGHTNAVTMDTRNDGSDGTYKMVLSLRNVTHTGPWFWHGWQDDLDVAVARSLVESMQGPEPTPEEVEQVVAYLETLTAPPNSHGENQSEAEARQRGQLIFEGDIAQCASCHSGPYFTDGQVHDVGLASEYDKYEGYNTPSLLGIGNRVRYLHHGRALSLDDLLSDLHSPEKVSGTRQLTEQERADLVAYLRSL